VYDPMTGRFLQTDPVGYKDDLDLYVYVGEDPLDKDDPLGLFESNPILRALVPGQVQWDEAVTAAQSGNWGQAAAHAGAMLGEQVLAVVTLGESQVEVRGGQIAGGAVRTQLERNAAQGAAGEARTAAKLGDKVAGKRITLESSTGRRSVADFVTKDRSVVETKTGGARLSPGQKDVKADVDAGRTVTPRGKNAQDAGLTPNQPTKMRDYKVDPQ
jgi:hypothetical protein